MTMRIHTFEDDDIKVVRLDLVCWMVVVVVL